MMSGTFAIRLANGSDREERTAAQLRAIFTRHDVSRWTFTHEIVIEQMAIPHSHPVLTLNTRHAGDDAALLSTFLHEQAHWWLTDHRPGPTREAMAELRGLYPSLPVGHPAGATDLDGSYLHLVVNYLELVALEEIAGPGEAARIFALWANDHYTELYRIVLEDRFTIEAMIRRHGLLP
jgi:hypothetical protein